MALKIIRTTAPKPGSKQRPGPRPYQPPPAQQDGTNRQAGPRPMQGSPRDRNPSRPRGFP